MTDHKTNTLSVILPAYNEEKIIRANVKTLLKFLDRLKLDNYEIVLVENGSTDNTLQIARELEKENKHMRVVSVPKAGYGNAVRIGARSVRYKKIIIYTTDLTFGLDSVKRMIEKLDDYPVVLGCRYMRDSEQDRPFIRIFISRSHNLLVNLFFGSHFNDVDCLKSFRSDVGREILARTKTNDAFIEVEMMAMVHTNKIPYYEVATSHIEPTLARHPSYLIKIVVGGFLSLVKNYRGLKKRKIKWG
jgi:glycosyltransferase involved in cell wall biosynthesis